MDAKCEKIASTYRFGGEGSHKAIRAMKDDAALVVHAVNTYEERERLLEEAAGVLRRCLDYFEACSNVIWEDAWPGAEKQMIKEMQSVVAKLEARDA